MTEAEAQERAEAELFSYLDDEQREMASRRGFFEVRPPARRGQKPRVYRISTRRMGWVERAEPGREPHLTLGIYPGAEYPNGRYVPYPAADAALAAMLLVLHDEEALLSVACKS